MGTQRGIKMILLFTFHQKMRHLCHSWLKSGKSQFLLVQFTKVKTIEKSSKCQNLVDENKLLNYFFEGNMYIFHHEYYNIDQYFT